MKLLNPDLLALENISGNIIAMACVAVLGIIFLFIVEADIFTCCSRLSFYKVPQPQMNLEYDDDVLKEHERLSR